MTTIRPRRSYPGYAKPVYVPRVTLRTRIRWLLEEALRSDFATDVIGWIGYCLAAMSAITAFAAYFGG